MRLRKVPLVAAGAMLLCLFCMAGCQGADGSFILFATPSPDPSPTPTPVPTPVPVIALAGAQSAPAYAAAVERAVTGAGLVFVSLDEPSETNASDPAPMIEPDTRSAGEAVPEEASAGQPGMAPESDAANAPKSAELAEALRNFSADGSACVILYCAETLPEPVLHHAAYPIFVCSAIRQTMPQGVSNVCYDGEMAPVEALQLALNLPPHLPPVRMLGLFGGKQSSAAEIWAKAVSDGLIMDRGTFFADDGDPAAALNDWLTDRMKKLYPGMLDCIYAETGALAVLSADTLLALGRTDAEIFAASTDGEACAYLAQYPAVMSSVVGMDVGKAARISAEGAMALLENPQQIVERSLVPQVFPVTSAEP